MLKYGSHVSGRSSGSGINLTTVLLGAVLLTPAVSLCSFWLGGELALVVTALAIPLCAAVLAILPGQRVKDVFSTPFASPLNRDGFERLATLSVQTAREADRRTAVFFFAIDDAEQLTERYGATAIDGVQKQMAERLRSGLRRDDLVGTWDTSTLALCLSAQPTIDLEICLELAGRLTKALSEPYAIDGTALYISASVGFCQLGREAPTPSADTIDPVIACAYAALEQALAAAPAGIRSFSATKTPTPHVARHAQDAVQQALENGEIVPWFQPQISTDTGKITGFEALARWIDPQKGPISPADFLPQLEAAGAMGRLSEIITYHAFTAIKAWDQAQLDVRQVGVNFSSAELSDPKLVEKISWELDRFELGADRLAVEILETVVAKGPDDVITRNIKSLHELGCRIDLDDFGTGHASLSSLRRFCVGRIKIDRSFVMKSDRDVEQQRMIRAILTMAEKLDLDTLAEGVETVGEHSLLAQLGCTHVQGYGIGRPMPFDQTLAWIKAHNEKLHPPLSFGKTAG